MLSHVRTCLLMWSQHPPLSVIRSSLAHLLAKLLAVSFCCEHVVTFSTQDAWILVAPLADALSPKPSAEHAREIATAPVPVPNARTCRPKRDATPPAQLAKGSQGLDSTQSVVQLTDNGRGRGGGMGRGRGGDRGRGRGRSRGKHRPQTGNQQEAGVGSMVQGKSLAGHVSHCTAYSMHAGWFGPLH